MRSLVPALLPGLMLLAACGAATGPAPAKPSAAPATIRYGLSGTGGATTVLRLANDHNLWAQEGLKAEMTAFQGDPIAYAALQAGELDFTAAGSEGGVTMALKGANVRIIGVLQDHFEYHLLGGKDVRSAQDLKGKTLAVSKLGSNSDFATREALKRLGVDPSSVTVLQVGNSVSRAAALESGAVQASIMSPDFVPGLLDKGFHDLADMSKMDIRYPFLCIGTTTTLLSSKPDLAQRFLRVVYRGIKLFRDDPEATQKILAGQTNETRKEVLQAGWENYRNVLATDLTPNPEIFGPLLKEIADTDAAAKDATPEIYIDDRPSRQLSATGFPQQLLGASSSAPK